MAFPIERLTRKVEANLPPRILIYGEPGIGKTTLASEFPNAFLIDIEGGRPAGVDIPGANDIELTTFDDVMDVLAIIGNTPGVVKTVIIDSLTSLERLIWQEMCNRGDEKGNKKRNIEEFGYGKGYVLLLNVWEEFLQRCNDLRNFCGVTVIFVAHSKIRDVKDPETVTYHRIEVDVHPGTDKIPGAMHKIERMVDMIMLLKRPVSIKIEDENKPRERALAKGGSTVFMHFVSRPSFIAKNRLLDFPEKIVFERGKGFDAIAPHIPHYSENASTEKAA